MKIGDIHWIQLPATSGREQMGNRPAIIVQSLSLSEAKERNLCKQSASSACYPLDNSYSYSTLCWYTAD